MIKTDITVGINYNTEAIKDSICRALPVSRDEIGEIRILKKTLKIEKEKYLDEIIDRQNWINRLLKYEKSDHLTREMVEIFIERINLFSATKIEICYKFSDIFEDVMSNGGVYIG